jgi:hypothetical protein
MQSLGGFLSHYKSPDCEMENNAGQWGCPQGLKRRLVERVPP